MGSKTPITHERCSPGTMAPIRPASVGAGPSLSLRADPASHYNLVQAPMLSFV